LAWPGGVFISHIQAPGFNPHPRLEPGYVIDGGPGPRRVLKQFNPSPEVPSLRTVWRRFRGDDMSTPRLIYDRLTGLLAEIRESDRVGQFVKAYCANPQCEVRWSTRPADTWNVGKKYPNGKPVPLRSYLRCHSCHSRLRHYQLS
jgi:hypothetical protein